MREIPISPKAHMVHPCAPIVMAQVWVDDQQLEVAPLGPENNSPDTTTSTAGEREIATDGGE